MKITKPQGLFERLGDGGPKNPLSQSMVFLLHGGDDGTLSFRTHFLTRLIESHTAIKPRRTNHLSDIQWEEETGDFFAPPPSHHVMLCTGVTDRDFKQFSVLESHMGASKTPVIIVLVGASLTTKSKWVTAVGDHGSWMVIPCYDVDGGELRAYASLFHAALWTTLSPGQQTHLITHINPGSLDPDLTKMALLAAGRGGSLSDQDVADCLTPSTHRDLDHFLHAVLVSGQIPSDRFLINLQDDGLTDIALVRLLSKDLKIVMTCHDQGITAASLKARSFSAGLRLPLSKMPYYAQLLQTWTTDRCVTALQMLIAYERWAKSGSGGAASSFGFFLNRLHHGRIPPRLPLEMW